MAFFERGGGGGLIGEGAAEIYSHVGFEGRLVALEAQDIVGAMVDDILSDAGLTAHGVDGDHGAGELACIGESVEHVGDGEDLVGFLGHAELGSIRRALVV